MWTCPKCSTQNVGGACSGCVVVVNKRTDDRKLPPSHPEYENRRSEAFFKSKEPIYFKTPEESHAFNKEKKAVADENRRIDLLLADRTFDTSLQASRERLEKALAIASEVALRHAKTEMVAEGAADFIMKIAQMYRTLANTVVSKDPSEMSEEELRKQVK